MHQEINSPGISKRKGAGLNFAMGTTLHRYATGHCRNRIFNVVWLVRFSKLIEYGTIC